MNARTLLFALPLVFSAGTLAAQEITTLKVLTPLPRHTAWYPLIAGEELGYFEAEGVKVELIPGGDLPATAFLDNGNADVASLDPTEVLNAHQRGLDFDVVYEVMHGAIEGIFVPQASDAETLADLKGTTIGIVGESDRPLLISALGHVGLTEGDVTVAVLGESAPLLANSLQNGRVSGVVGAVSDLVAIRSQGVDVKNLLPPEMSEAPANSYAMRADKVEEMEELMNGFLRAWAKGAYAGQSDPKAVAAMTKKIAPENWVREDLGMLFLENAVDLHTPDGENYGALRPEIWTGVQEEMVASGQLDQVIETSEFLDDRFIGPANDFDRAQVDADVKAWADANM